MIQLSCEIRQVVPLHSTDFPQPESVPAPDPGVAFFQFQVPFLPPTNLTKQFETVFHARPLFSPATDVPSLHIPGTVNHRQVVRVSR